MRCLLEKGAKVGQVTNDGTSPLMIAVQVGHVDVVRLLLEHGADVEQATNGGKTPLLIACEKGNTDAVRLLLKKGADANKLLLTHVPFPAVIDSLLKEYVRSGAGPSSGRELALIPGKGAVFSGDATHVEALAKRVAELETAIKVHNASLQAHNDYIKDHWFEFLDIVEDKISDLGRDAAKAKAWREKIGSKKINEPFIKGAAMCKFVNAKDENQLVVYDNEDGEEDDSAEVKSAVL